MRGTLAIAISIGLLIGYLAEKAEDAFRAARDLPALYVPTYGI